MPDLPIVVPVHREHLEELTGEFGIMQHARGTLADPDHGYCTDDVARALVVDLLQARVVGWEVVAPSARRSLAFLTDALDAGQGRFLNLRRADGSWIEEVGSEDSHGRAMWALGETIRRAPDPAVRLQAATTFARALPAALGLTAIRARASSMLGCDAALRGGETGSALPAAYRRLTAGLLRTFEASEPVPDWSWPEDTLTYENGLLAQALIVSGPQLEAPDAIGTGLRVLDWLLAVQTLPDGRLSPIGCHGWWPRDGVRARFDQQPIEATSLLLAADAAYRTTGRECYRAAAERAYAWFLGDNDVGVPVADPELGGCHDGLTPDGVNANQGAESTLMWLTAVERIRALRKPETMAHPTGQEFGAHQPKALSPPARADTHSLARLTLLTRRVASGQLRAAKLLGLAAALCIFAIYERLVGSPRRRALFVALSGFIGAATNVLGVAERRPGAAWADCTSDVPRA